MATIMEDEQQLKALETVNQNIQLITTISNMMEQNIFVLSCPALKKNNTCDVESSCNDKILQVLKTIKDKYSRDTKKLAAKNRIRLSPEELAVLDGD